MTPIRSPRISDLTYDEIMKEYVRPWAESRGLREELPYWFGGWDGDRYNRVNSIRIKSRGQDHCTLRILLAVGFRTIAETLRSPGMPQWLKRRDPARVEVVSSDLGALSEQKNEIAWDVWPDTTAPEIGEEIVRRLETDGVRFFEENATQTLALSALRAKATSELSNLEVAFIVAHLLASSAAEASAELQRRIYDLHVRATTGTDSWAARRLEELLTLKMALG